VQRLGAQEHVLPLVGENRAVDLPAHTVQAHGVRHSGLEAHTGGVRDPACQAGFQSRTIGDVLLSLWLPSEGVSPSARRTVGGFCTAVRTMGCHDGTHFPGSGCWNLVSGT